VSCFAINQKPTNLKYFFLLTAFLFVILNIEAQQITTDSSISLEQLILNNLAEGCVEISNISSSINGSASSLESYGYFEKGTSNFPFQNGIVLSTGSVGSAGNTLNTNILAEGTDAWGTDTDLEDALSISNTLNATSIEFDFVSFSNVVQFNYLLASEEYYETNPCNYSDGFAFLIKEAGTADAFKNIALIPGTNEAVNTTTIHENIVGFCPAKNESYFDGFNVGDTNFNGRTVVLTANAAIKPNVKYHIKLVIADQTDYKFDSAVFIEGNSFNATVDIGPDVSTCANIVELNADINNNLASYAWFLNGGKIAGASNSTYTASASGNYKVEITLQVNNTSCLIEDDIEITLNGEQSFNPISDFIRCDDSSNDGKESFNLDEKYNEIYYSVASGTYNISYHTSENDAKNNSSPITTAYTNTSNPQTIYVRVEETNNGCLAYPTFNLIVNETPEISDPDPIVVCDDEDNDGFTIIDLTQANESITGGDSTLQVTYHYSQQDADSGYYQIYPPYTNINPTDTLYVRVYNSFTGCYSTTTIDVTVTPNPPIEKKGHYINFCKIDDDGIESFDLTEVIPNVLDGFTNGTSTFHVTEEDARAGVNAIADETSYNNIEPYFQLIFIRVVDKDTGCYSIAPIQLHINLVEYGFDFENYIVCDDFSNDGQEYFNLLNIQDDIAQDYGDLDFIFYENQDDFDNEANPLDKSVPYLVSSSPKTLYTMVIDGDCKVEFLINLVINPALELPDIDSVDYCDTDTDGYTSVILETFNRELTEGISPVSINYYLSEIDALNDENRLPPTFYNSNNPQILYIRVSNPQSGCVAVKPIELNIITAPPVNYPENIIICDDDQDAYSIVDLTQVVPEIVSDTSDLEITYFDNYWSAFNDETQISDPEIFNATNQYIYFRVQSKTTSCFNISAVYINVNTLPVFTDISIFENCESGTNDIADFYFYTKDAEILNGQPGKQVLYFETEQDAIDRINEIGKYDIYNNTSNPQTIHVRVESVTDADCYGTSSFDLEVGSIPLFNEPEDISVCDDASNDGVETFDLSSTIDFIKEGINDNLTVTLHTSNYDAENGLNEIDPNFTNYYNPQQLYARITNGTYCHGIADFSLSIIQVPNTTEPSPLKICDVDYDGLVTLDLTLSELEILDLRQDNLVITYHTTLDGVENNTDIIPDPENYNNISNPQTVYIKVNNTVSDCSVFRAIEIVADLPPPIIEFESYEICDNPSKFFDLNTINTEISNNDPDAIISYYTNSADAEIGNTPISTNFTYTNANTQLYVRVESISRTCHYVYPFKLIVNPLPVANQPLDMEACDDVSADSFEIFDLSLQNASILGGQNSDNFTITYYDNQASAINNKSAIDIIYNAQNGQVIYARIENNITGCFSTTQFNVIVHLHPNQVPDLVQCDVDYDETVVFDISTHENDLFATASSNIVVSYFDDLSLIDDDTASITDPVNYTNLTNPQTIYIKVYNVSANCYNVINQELIVTSAPAINEFETYEICDNVDRYFDLNTINSVIVDNDSDAVITYHLNNTDAENNIAPISTDYTYATVTDAIYIRIESAERGCHYVYPFQLVVNPLPIAYKPADMESCDDDYDNLFKFDLSSQNTHVYGSQRASDYSVTYFISEDDANNKTNVLDSILEVNTEQLIYVRIENNNTGCFSLTDFMIYVRRKPINDIEDQVICLDNFPLQVNAQTGFDTDSYLWMPNGETTPNITITEIGDYSLTITSNFGCVTTKDFNVIESERAMIEFEETVDFSDPNSISITVSGIGDYVYQLDDGEPQQSNFFDDVRLGSRIITIIDLNGCNSVSKEIMIFDVPLYFTPNNDGFNDVWHITGANQLVGTIIYIYDRYGKLLKTLPHNTLGWDGTYNGENMPTADYWYHADVVYKGEKFKLKGHFTLKR
jgi:gliding motility-associated-like protein